MRLGFGVLPLPTPLNLSFFSLSLCLEFQFMDDNKWRAAQGESNLNMDGSDWRADLPPDYRQQVVNELMDAEKNHIPLSGPDELVELKKMAVRFEEEIYTAAPTQKDYWQKISTKIHTMDAKSQASVSRASSLPSNSTDGNQSLPDLGSISEQIQVGNPAQQPLPFPMVTQSQSVQQIPPQNHQSIVSSSMVQNSVSLPPSMPSPTEVTQNAMCSIVGQNSNSLTSISGLSHNSASSSEVGQGVLPHIFANPQSQQLQGRHQGVPQQQSQNPQQQYVIYEQQLFNQKLHQGNIQPSLLVSHPQQQQQPLLQSSQMQGAQQSLTPRSPGLLTSQPTLHQKQTSMMQASAQSCLQQKNPSTPQSASSVIQQHRQSGLGQQQHAPQSSVYQQIKSMKDMYLRDLKEYYMKICWKIQNVDAISQGPGPLDQLTKLNNHRGLVDKLLCFLSVTRSNILPDHRDKVADVEKQIFDILNSSRLRKSTSSQQQPRNQTHQLLQHENHGGQIQPVKARGSVTSGLLLSGSIPSSTHFGVPPTQYNVMRSHQPTTNPDSVQGNALGLRQQGMVGSLQQNMERGTQQTNNSTFSYCSGNAVEPNMNTLQQNSNVQQQQQQRQHLNQEEQQQKIMRSEQLKWFQQHHMHPQLIQQQNQLHQQQQQSQQMSQLHQMNNQVNGLKVRQGIGVNKPGILSQHHQLGSRSTSKYQQLKTGVSLSVSSPQLLQPHSPQISQQSSPQIEQQSFLSSLSRTGASLQAANSPFIATSPSTPMLTPSPVAGDPEKQNSCVSSIPEAGNLGHQQLGHSLSQAQFPAISTPGISASPLLAEFPSPERNQGSVAEVLPGKSTATEQPVERLINAVKSTSANAMSSSMSDIGSVMSIVDRLSGSAPCYVSKAVVGKDLVATTKCRLQGRNFIPPGGNALAATMKLRRHISSLPATAVSSVGNVNNDSFKGVSSLTSDLVSNGTSRIKRRRVETNHALLEEISEINQSLIDTVVEIGDEEFDSIEAAPKGKGTIVKCSFSAIAVSPNLRTEFSSQMAPILPLRLLVPVSYPNCAPVILDKVPVETSNEIEDLSDRAKSRFSTFLRGLSEPMSLGEMARTWDACARKAIVEYAQQSGGGTFSSIYGTWENCVGA